MKKYVIILVEGETEKVFYKRLLEFYRGRSSTKMLDYEVHSVGGFGNFDNKAVSKLKNGIIPKIEKSGNDVFAVGCSYDTDVFEYAAIPPINWAKVKRGVKELGIRNFIEIKAKLMIEDWFLKDIDGLCAYLKIKNDIKSISGKDGNRKMQSLFKRGNKIYQKGRYTQKFMDSLDIEKIRASIVDELAELERVLNVTI